MKVNRKSKPIKLDLNGSVTANENFKVLKDGSIEAYNGKFIGGIIQIKDNSSNGTSENIKMTNNNNSRVKSQIGSSGFIFESYNSALQFFNSLDDDGVLYFNINGGKNGSSKWNTSINMQCGNGNNDGVTGIFLTDKNVASTFVTPSEVKSPLLTQSSLAEYKKNFEKLEDNALKKLKEIDIYKYNLKCEKDTDKKHIGFVIGDNYNYSKEVTSVDNQGVDNYSFTSLCCKAIQELSEKVEQLQKEVKELKGGNNK